MSKKTSLYDEHIALGAKMIDFGGFLMPVQYKNGIINEYNACRDDLAIFDTSHMGEFVFKGDIAKSGVNDAVTQDLVNLPIGRCKYGFILNENGTIIDDTIIYKISDNELFFVVNAGTSQNDFLHIKKHIKDNCEEFKDISNNIAKLDVQGKNAINFLENFIDDDIKDLEFFSFKKTKILGEEFLLSRTGYTGELGFELYIDPKKAVELWQKFIAKGISPAGLGARDVLRLEMGYSLYGNDIDESKTPIEASLGFFINYDTNFTGKEALLKQKEEGRKIFLKPFIANSRRTARKAYKIYKNDKEIGVVTSGAYSPKLNKSIGLGYINENLKLDDDISIVDGNIKIEAKISKLPFYKESSLKL